MLLDCVFEAVHKLVMIVHSRLHNDSPSPAIHEPIVGAVHRLIGPDRVGGVEADRHTQLSGFVPERIETRIVWVRSERRLRARGDGAARIRWPSVQGQVRNAPLSGSELPCILAREDAPPLIMELADSFGAGAMALLERFDGIGPEAALVHSAQIEHAPQVEAVGVSGVFACNHAKAFDRTSARENDALLDA